MASRPVIGIRYPQWSSYGPSTMAGVVDFMRGHEPWRLVTENDSYGEMEAVRIDGSWHGDGVVLFRAAEEELAAFRKRGVAVVLTSSEGPDLGFPRVVPDNRGIGRLAAEHLIECNLGRYAFLARGETVYREARYAPGMRVYARERLKGYRARLGDYSFEPRVHYLRGRPLWERHTWREVQTEVMAFLDSLPKACGLFVADDSLGAVALRAADALGRKVPEELVVIGYGDDHAYCYATYPALSSIAHPAREIGLAAARLLRHQMRGETDGMESRVVPVGSVLIRESSDVLAIDDPEIRELVAWIRRRAPRDAVRVAELAERSRLSPTTIKQRFAKVLGHSPKQEIQRVRLAHLKHLLEGTDLSISRLADQMGFASSHELSRFFLAETGVRPTRYREQSGPAGRVPELEGRSADTGAVLFDMDGTLFDSETLYFDAFRQAYAEQGGELGREQYFGEHAGTTNDAIEQHLAARAPGGFDLARFAGRWRELLDAVIAGSGLSAFPGVRELLEGLVAGGVSVGLASSSEIADIERMLEAAGLAGFFPVRAGGDEVVRGKPDPEVFLLAARRLGVDPAACLVVEDSEAGILAAHRAGMRILHVHRGNPVGKAAAARVTRSVHSLAEVSCGDLLGLMPGRSRRG